MDEAKYDEPEGYEPQTTFLHSEQLNELAGALSKAQGEITHAVKNAKNPFFKSSYADLAAIVDATRGPLSKNGLAVIQGPFTTRTGRVIVRTRIIHSSGQWIECAIDAEPKDLGPQAIGSVITYLRRYGLSSIAGVATEDDDGEAGEARKQTEQDTSRRNAYPQQPQSRPAAPAPASAKVTTDSILSGRTESATTKRGADPKSGPRPAQRRLDEETVCEHGVALQDRCVECQAHLASAR